MCCSEEWIERKSSPEALYREKKQSRKGFFIENFELSESEGQEKSRRPSSCNRRRVRQARSLGKSMPFLSFTPSHWSTTGVAPTIAHTRVCKQLPCSLRSCSLVVLSLLFHPPSHSFVVPAVRLAWLRIAFSSLSLLVSTSRYRQCVLSCYMLHRSQAHAFMYLALF